MRKIQTVPVRNANVQRERWSVHCVGRQIFHFARDGVEETECHSLQRLLLERSPCAFQQSANKLG